MFTISLAYFHILYINTEFASGWVKFCTTHQINTTLRKLTFLVSFYSGIPIIVPIDIDFCSIITKSVKLNDFSINYD